MNHSLFIPSGVYEDIINTVGKWKILDMSSLRSLLNYDLNYRNFLYKVKKLENNGLVRTEKLGQKNKHVFLTNKGIQFTSHDKTYEITSDNLTHDIITGNVLRSFLEFKNFYDVRMFHQIKEYELEPDAQVLATKNGLPYNLALEIELTQKSSIRVKTKFSKYLESKYFDYCLFITNKKSLFNAYKMYLLSMTDKVQEKIILMLSENMRINQFNYEESICFFKKSEKSFREIFSD